MKTTLNKIKAHNPCDEGWKKLLAHLGKTEADDEELSLLTILESNGLEHAIWALRAVDGYNREIRLFACDCAEHVLPIFEVHCPDDKRPRHAIETSRRFANGVATKEELASAMASAWDAARDAARASAWAAMASARDAAWDAARDAARASAWDAERDYQKQLFTTMVNEANK